MSRPGLRHLARVVALSCVLFLAPVTPCIPWVLGDVEAAGTGKAPCAPKSVPVLDDADPYALLADVREAHSADRDVRAVRLDDVSRAWRGRRVRWELGVLRPLCASAAGCVVLPFDQARLTEPSGQGWLPRLELDLEEHARIAGACGRRELCVIEVEATVKRARLSTELPTAVTLTDVRMLSARAPAAGESWVRYPAAAWQAGTSRSGSGSASTGSSERSAAAAWAPSTRRGRRISAVASR